MWGSRSSPRGARGKKGSSCCVCGEGVTRGSWPATVSDPRRGYEGVCLSCSGRGHTAGDCPSPPMCGSCRKRQTLGCSICGGIGHCARECPSPLCRRCGSRGHYETDCLIGGPMPISYNLRLSYPGEDLGVVLGQTTPDSKMLVTGVRPGGPGELAGMTVGMAIETIDGHRIPSTSVLYSVLHGVHSRKETNILIDVSQPSEMRGPMLAARAATHYLESVELPPPPMGENDGFELAPSYSPDGNRRFAGSPPAIPRKPTLNPLHGLSRKSPKFV